VLDSWWICVLQVLRLAANRLSSVAGTWLRPLTQLRTLDLSDNPLTTLESDSLSAAGRLVSLNVSGTRLSRLVTRHLAALTVLDLTRCHRLGSAPDISSLTRLQRLALPAHVCRCDAINFRSLVRDARRSTWRPRPALLYCGDTATALDIESICSADNTSSHTANQPPPPPSADGGDQHLADIRTDDPLPYDPKLGWYTAAVLSGLLFAFIACVGLEKAEKHLLEACVSRQANKKQQDADHLDQRRLSPPPYQQQQRVRIATDNVCTVAEFENFESTAGVDNTYLDTETPAT